MKSQALSSVPLSKGKPAAKFLDTQHSSVTFGARSSTSKY